MFGCGHIDQVQGTSPALRILGCEECVQSSGALVNLLHDRGHGNGG